jgi:hypothetical protein
MASWVTLQYAIAEADRALVATVNRWCDVGWSKSRRLYSHAATGVKVWKQNDVY